jgi:hypothetical protein
VEALPGRSPWRARSAASELRAHSEFSDGAGARRLEMVRVQSWLSKARFRLT